MTTELSLVLLVDDDEVTNYLHQRTIELTGLVEEVATAIDGQAALDLLTGSNGNQLRRPDTIFLDINMPGMNGFEFLDAYAQLAPETQGRLLVLMLTTSLPTTDSKRAEENEHIDKIVAKPLTADLIHEIANQAST